MFTIANFRHPVSKSWLRPCFHCHIQYNNGTYIWYSEGQDCACKISITLFNMITVSTYDIVRYSILQRHLQLTLVGPRLCLENFYYHIQHDNGTYIWHCEGQHCAWNISIAVFNMIISSASDIVKANIVQQVSTLRKKITSPAGLVTVTFTSPEISFASPDINIKNFQIVTNPIASVDNMKRMQCIVFN